MCEFNWRDEVKHCLRDFNIFGKTPLEKRMSKLLKNKLQEEEMKYE